MGVVFGKVNEETPDREVISNAEGYQVWRYSSSVAAAIYANELATDGQPPPSGRDFQSQAFKILAKYIGVFTTPENSGASTAESPSESDPTPVAMTAPVVITPPPEKINMTAPVVMDSPESPSGESMRFLLPSRFESVEAAPKPKDERVRLEMAPAGRTEAVLQFSWGIDMERGKEKAEELKKLLERDGVKVTGDWNLQGYNPPFTLPWCKRNEVHIPVDPDTVKKGEETTEASTTTDA